MLSTIPCTGFLYLQFLARCHPYILLTLGAHARGLRYLVCVCVCVSVCPAPRVLPLRATERRYLRPRRKLKNILNMAFSRFVQKLWREKANKLSMCLPRHHMAPMERHFARNFKDRAFSGSFKVYRPVTSYLAE